MIQKDFVKAEKIYREALDSRRRVLGNEHPDTIWSLSYLGRMLQQVGRYREAEPYLRESMQTRRRTQGVQHLRSMEATITYAQLLHNLKEFDEALEYYRDAEKNHVQVHGEEAVSTRHVRKMIQSILDEQQAAQDAIKAGHDDEDASGKP